MADLWAILDRTPWMTPAEPGDGVYLVAHGEHVLLGSYSGQAGSGPGYVLGFESGQVDIRGAQIVRPCLYSVERHGIELRASSRCPREDRGPALFVPIQ